MKNHPWQNLAVRIVVGWLVVSILPAVVLFWKYILLSNWQLTQLNSLIASSFSILVSQIALDKFSKFPGQGSIVMILPIVLSVAITVGLVLLLFRLQYSVYYLTFSFFLAVVFCFVSHIWLRSVTQFVMGYVPFGRCIDLLNIEIYGIRWVELDVNYKPKNYEPIPLHAVVADLADSSLTDSWEKQLAEMTLRGIPVYNVLQVRESLTGRIPIKHLYENNLGSLLPSPIYLFIKRLLDTLIILFFSPIVIPVCLLVIVGIAWESPGKNAPFLFIQKRVGQGGQLFTMYKFRSMIPSSEKDGAKMAVSDDMRITRFGKFIRRFRLDELPQFVNVLKGEMSLIGPRPEQPSFVEQFNNSIPFYSYRHIVKPGISGWAQVTHGYAGDEDETRVKLEYDFYYIKNFSLTLDLLIVIKTVQTMLTGFGAR